MDIRMLRAVLTIVTKRSKQHGSERPSEINRGKTLLEKNNKNIVFVKQTFIFFFLNTI